MRLLIKFCTGVVLLFLVLIVVSFAIARVGLKDLDSAARNEQGGS